MSSAHLTTTAQLDNVPTTEAVAALLEGFGVTLPSAGMPARTPITGAQLGFVAADTPAQVTAKIAAAQAAFVHWRVVPAPKRGELVRVYGEILRQHKAELGRLVSIEAGKIFSEGLGEVQEMIDICGYTER